MNKKISSNSDGQQLNQYQGNEELSLTWNQWTPRWPQQLAMVIHVMTWDRHI